MPANIAAVAGYRALAAVGRSVVKVMNDRFPAAVRDGDRPPTAVLAGSMDLDLVGTPDAVITYPAVSVFCYRLSVDKETRPGWSAVAARDGIPRLPLRMHLLVTAWDQFVERELEWLGLAAHVLETHSVLSGPQLDDSGDWHPGDTVQIVPDDMALESMSEAFQALTTDFRLYLLYQARVVVIDGSPGGEDAPVATVGAGLGAVG